MLAELEEPLELDGVTMAAAPLDDRSRLPPNTYVGYAGYGTDHHGVSVQHFSRLLISVVSKAIALKYGVHLDYE